MDLTTKIYLVSIAVLGGLAIYIINRIILRIENKRLKNVRNLDGTEPIITNTPITNPKKILQRAAVTSIENRFSIIRKLIINLLILLLIVAILFPFLDKIPATIISVFIGSTAVIIGIAAKPYIENFISGVVITFAKPFRTSDTVIVDGNYGTVEDITLTHTIIKIWNWRRYIIPNSQMLSKEFVNLTIKDKFQWMHVEFWVAHHADIKKVRELAIQAAQQSAFFSDHEEPTFWVMEMGKEAVKCWIAAWADSPQSAWELGNDIRTELMMKFQEAGIQAHRFVHAYSPNQDTIPSAPVYAQGFE